MKKHKVISQRKGQDKTQEKPLNKVDRQPSKKKKKIQNNDTENDPGSWENNEDAKQNKTKQNIYQGPKRIKERTVNNVLEGINRITEAE